ncbi:hypothetical protein Hanom_Chr14g01328051 [Helianthus anomalus]
MIKVKDFYEVDGFIVGSFLRTLISSSRRCYIAFFYRFSYIPGVVVLLRHTYTFMCLFLLFLLLCFLVVVSLCMFSRILCLGYGFEADGFTKAVSLSSRKEVRFVYISHSLDSTNSLAINEIILGKIVVICELSTCRQGRNFEGTGVAPVSANVSIRSVIFPIFRPTI